MEEKVLKLLKEINEDITDDIDKDILADGIIDSFDIANIVAELEEEFAIEIDAEDIIPENFSTVRAMVELVGKYKGV